MLHAARWKRRIQKWPKITRLRTIAQLYRAVSVQLRHVSRIGKKLLNSIMSSTCLHNMANIGPLAAEIGSGVWGTPANLNGFRVLPSLLQRRRSPEDNQTFHNVWPSPGLVRNIYTFGISCPLTTCKIHFVSIYAPSHKFLGLYLRN